LSFASLVSSRTGFFFGWWVVFASAALIFLTGGTFFYGFGALFNPIVDEFGWSRASVSLAFSLRSEVGGLAAPVVGFMVDRVGARRLMTMGVALVALGFLLMSRMQSLWTFYGAVVIIGIGISSAGYPVSMVAIAHWFRRQRGRAMAMMTAGAGTSGVMVLVLSGLISSFGWRSALTIMAISQLVICVPLALSVRNKPQDLGLNPDGDPDPPAEEGDGTITLRSGPVPETEGMTVREALRTSAFWRLSLAITLANLGAIAIIVHQIPFFTSTVGLSEGIAAASVTAFTFMSLGGRFGFGFLADAVDKRKVMAASLALIGLAILLFSTIYEAWQIVLVLPLFAIGWGGFIPVRPAFQAEYFGLRAFGGIQGLMFTIGTLGGLAGPVFAGWIYDTTESYRLAFAILSAGGLAAALLVLTMPKPQRHGQAH
jgi:sugar phosphate permease